MTNQNETEIQQETAEQNNDNNLQKLADEILRLREDLNNKSEIIIREMAENENLRRRHARELEESAKYSIGSFSKDLIEVMESLYRAINFQKEFDMTDSKIAGMFDGMNMTLKLLEKSFNKYGIQRVEPINSEFDHRYHQAISKISVPNTANNQIVNVIQAGYIIHDRLLKPALVVVNVNEE